MVKNICYCIFVVYLVTGSKNPKKEYSGFQNYFPPASEVAGGCTLPLRKGHGLPI
jgi:hypothetical protein